MEKTSDEPLPQRVLEAVEQWDLEAHADLQRFDAQFMEQFADTKDWQTLIALLELSAIRRFDLCAEQLLFTSVTPDRAVSNPLYEQYLYWVLKEKFLPYISHLVAPLRADIRDDFISRIDLKLRSRILHWLAESKQRLLTLRRSGKAADATANQRSELSRTNRRSGTVPVSEIHGIVKAPRRAKLTKEEEVSLETKLKKPSVYKLVSVKDAAIVLKKSASTIYRYVSEGKLTCPERMPGRIHTKSLIELSKAPKLKRG